MQKLVKRTERNTPTSISQACGNCGQSLKVMGTSDGVAGSKTLSNNLDATLTDNGQSEQSLRVSVVYVLNKRGKPLMPCSAQKARILLKKGEANVVKRTPFTIQLTKQTGEAKQCVKLGVDPGYKHVGLSAVTDKKELISFDSEIRTDIVKLLSEKRMYRRTRRHRKTWHRKPRFSNRGIKEGWIAPSLQHKIDSHIKLINYVCSLVPVSEIYFELTNFDIQKIDNQEIEGEQYQQGVQLDFENAKQYVLFRDNYTCQHCGKKGKDVKFHVHHIESRQTGGNRPNNLLTLCEGCHKKHHEGKIELKLKKNKGHKAETFMNIVRKYIYERLKEEFKNIEIVFTYGYITKYRRKELGLEKSHTNDAYIISGGNNKQIRTIEYLIKQNRRSNRKLFKGERSEVKNVISRYIYGFQKNDKVIYKGKECFISGRRSTGYFDLKKLNGTKIHSSAKVKDIKLLESANCWLIEKK